MKCRGINRGTVASMVVTAAATRNIFPYMVRAWVRVRVRVRVHQ